MNVNLKAPSQRFAVKSVRFNVTFLTMEKFTHESHDIQGLPYPL